MAYDYSSLCEGTLVNQLATSTTTGVTVQLKKVNGNYTTATWPTGQHEIFIKRSTEDGIYAERILVASGTTQNNTTGVVTLGTLTRNLSITDGSDVTGSSATVTWPPGTLVYCPITVLDAEQMMKKHEVNTITGSGAIRGSSTTVPMIRIPSVTTTQRDNMTVANGDIVYNSTTGLFNCREGGAWQTLGTGSVSDGSTTVAGKFEEATVAEQGSATATGGTGARLIPAVANIVKTSAGAADENKLNVLNAAGVHDVSTGGTGISSPTANRILLTNGTSAMTLLAPGTSGNVIVSNGTTFTSTTVPTTSRVVYLSGTSSATQTNPTSFTAFDTHTVTIPANELISGVGYEVECGLSFAIAAGALQITFMLGGTAYSVLASAGAGTTGLFRGFITGTTSAGAAAAVRATGTFLVNDDTVLGHGFYGTANFATNGSLALAIGANFSSSNAGNNATLTMCRISKISSTAF